MTLLRELEGNKCQRVCIVALFGLVVQHAINEYVFWVSNSHILELPITKKRVSPMSILGCSSRQLNRIEISAELIRPPSG
jgi:hypothetical protein